jgi:hypothetical protein
MKDIIVYHGNDIIFKTFLYHFLEKLALLRLKGQDIFAAIIDVLHDSCEITEKILDSLKRCNDTFETTIHLFNWFDIPERYDVDNIKFLDNIFDLHLGQQIRLEKTDKGKILRISDENENIVSIKLDEKEDKASLTSYYGNQYELCVERAHNKLIIGVEKSAAKKYLLERFSNYVNRDPESLAFILFLNLNVKSSETREYDSKVLMDGMKLKHGNDKSINGDH